MKVVTRIGQFKKDYKRAIKARKNINKLREVVHLLANVKNFLTNIRIISWPGYIVMPENVILNQIGY